MRCACAVSAGSAYMGFESSSAKRHGGSRRIEADRCMIMVVLFVDVGIGISRQLDIDGVDVVQESIEVKKKFERRIDPW